MPRKQRQRRDSDDGILVKVVQRKGKPNFVLRWKDPATGKTREEATEIEAVRGRRRLAERAAREKEDELSTAQEAVGMITFAEFETRYAREYLSGLALNSQVAWSTAKAHLIRVVKPLYLTDITTSALSKLAGDLRRGTDDRPTVKETTIASYLRTIHAALWWAGHVGLLATVPKAPMPPRAKGITKDMRSRPITGEEFDRMLKAVRKIRPDDAKRWRRALRGLWLSGLRLSEAVILSWDWNSPFSVCLDGKFPMLRIHSEGEKGHKDRLLPMAPEFAEFLRRAPEARRKGLVFRLGCTVSNAGRIIADIGDKAGIVVNSDGKTVTAHDLRRSFGTRWAGRVAPAELKELMRHKSIETTMKYYVRLNADQLAEKLWSHHTEAAKVTLRVTQATGDKPDDALSRDVKEL